MKKRKTYQEFLEFIEQSKFVGATYSSIRKEAMDNGFKGWLFDYYTRKHNKQYKIKRFKPILKYIFYGFVYFSLFCFSLDVLNLIKSATIRNETETLALVIDICHKTPKLCEYAVTTGNLKLKTEQKE